jgi:hypothetical protein
VGRIHDPDLQHLADHWSPVVHELLHDVGQQIWPPIKLRRMLVNVTTVARYVVEGPAQWGSALIWAVSHTTNPSSFDEQGRLSRGERAYWLVKLHPGNPAFFIVEGAQVITGVAADRDAVTLALKQAVQSGPKCENFYGNKGPLCHR